jgi:hypothetical protein
LIPLASTLQYAGSEGLPIAELRNVRTEIVLKDERDVAFWFSFVVRLVTTAPAKKGKLKTALAHQMRVSPNQLFPRLRRYDENSEVSDDESSGAD